MKILIKYEISEKQYNIKLILIGMVLFVFRLLAIQPYYEIDGRINPDMLHTSKLISILTFISLICCFRYKVLNAIPIVGYPMIIVAFFADDFQHLIHPLSSGFFLWMDALTNHLIVIFIGLYVIITLNNSISIQSLMIAIGIVISWFICVDDHINGHLDGLSYIILCLVVFISWDLLVFHKLLRESSQKKDHDMFFAPIIKNIKISISKNKNKINIK